MPLDPQARLILDQLEAAGMPDFASVDPMTARNLTAAGIVPSTEAVAGIDDRTIPGPDAEIPVRIYTPVGTGPFGVLVFFHGGGWVICSLDSHDGICRTLANKVGCVVVSVDYRLAPEHPFPAAPEDCFAATRWVAANAASINVDPGRIAVGGDSAGGNLAAAVAVMARLRGGPTLCHQTLVYPVTDHSFDTASYSENAEGYLLSRNSMRWFWGHYLSSDADGDNPLASVLRVKDLSGLPPAHVVTAEFDPLRDEGEAYASRLRDAGVATTATRFDGMIHGFFTMGAVLDAGARAVDEAASELRAAFSA